MYVPHLRIEMWGIRHPAYPVSYSIPITIAPKGGSSMALRGSFEPVGVKLLCRIEPFLDPAASRFTVWAVGLMLSATTMLRPCVPCLTLRSKLKTLGSSGLRVV